MHHPARFLTLLVPAVLLLGGCGDGAGADVDAGVVMLPPDAAAGEACNPVEQTGCPTGQKCSTLQVGEDLARTTCVPEGTVQLGEACAFGDPGPDTGYDDCVKGGLCINDLCSAICTQAPNSCDDGNCVQYAAHFQDLENIGVCAPACDPVIQDCPGELGCYLNATLGESACARVPEEAESLGQDDDCYGPEAGRCYLNGCPEGFGALLNKGGPDGPGGSVCAAFCSPVVQHTEDTTAPDGDAAGVTCSSRGAVGYECRFLNSFYSNTGTVPSTVGFCVPPDLWGSCANHVLDTQNAEEFVPGCQPLEAAAALGATLPTAPATPDIDALLQH